MFFLSVYLKLGIILLVFAQFSLSSEDKYQTIVKELKKIEDQIIKERKEVVNIT